jgi:hypothetical protein
MKKVQVMVMNILKVTFIQMIASLHTLRQSSADKTHLKTIVNLLVVCQ